MIITKFKVFENHLITEIADTEVEPIILYKDPHIDFSKFIIRVKKRLYMIHIHLYGSKESAMLKVDFMVQLPRDPKKTIWYDTELAGEYDTVLTNDKDALLIIANIMGVIKYWASLDIPKGGLGQPHTNFKEIVLKGLWIRSKSETKGDKRRANLYSYFIKKNLQKIGLEVLSEKDVTAKFKNLFEDDYEGPHFTMQYKITPVTIDELDKKFSRDKIEMFGDDYKF